MCTVNLLVALLVWVNVSLAVEGIVLTMPIPSTPELSKSTSGSQCIILNRTSPNFERELLSVPPNACIIIVGSWIIKTNFFFVPTDMVSPKGDVWQITWKDLNSPLTVGNKTWDVKLKTQGTKQVIASLSYRF
jgi:hypothetical protein